MKILSALFAASFTLSGLVAADAAPTTPAGGDAPSAKAYPLTTCIVSGEALDSMGKPIVLVQDGQEVKLCCKGCIKKFNKDPAGYVAKINEEAAKHGAEPVAAPASVPADEPKH